MSSKSASEIKLRQLDNLHRIVYDTPPSFSSCNESGCNIPDTADMRAAFASYQECYLKQIESEGAQPGEPLIGHLPNLLDLVPSKPLPSRRLRVAHKLVPSVPEQVSVRKVAPVSIRKVAPVSVRKREFVQFLPSDDISSKLSSEELAYTYTFPNKDSVLETMRNWIIVVNKNTELEESGKALLSDNFSIVNLAGDRIRLSDIPMKQYVVERIISCTVPGNILFPLLNGEIINT